MNDFLRDKRVWYGAGILVALLIFGGVMWFFRKPATQLPGEIASSTQEQTATTTASTTASSPSPAETTVSKSLTYEQALAQYADRRIQIQPGCQLSPATPVFKNGTYVMFDNRIPTAQAIALDGVRYIVGGYGFRIIRLSAVRLPHTITVDCGSGRNNGQITLQG